MASEPDRRQSPWRFSLLSLLAATTFVALLAWLYTQLWRLDDLIFIALWCACVVVGAVYGRRRAMRGIVIAALLGGLVPFAGYMAYHLSMYFVWRMVEQTEAFFRLTQLAIVIMGGLSVATVAAMFVAFDRLSQHGQRTARHVAALVVVVAACAFLGIAFYRYTKSWRPFLTLPLAHAQGQHPVSPAIAFSADGLLLAVAVIPSAEQARKEVELRIWDVRTGQQQRAALLVPCPRSLYFAPDGKSLAVVRDDGFSILDLASGQLINNVIAGTANPWISQNCAFSPDGESFVASTYDGKLLKAIVWETQDWTVRNEHVLSETALPVVAANRLALLEFSPGTSSNVTLIDLESQTSLYPVRHSLGVYCPMLHSNGKDVVVGQRILNLQTGESRELPGPVICLAHGGKLGVMRRCDMEGHRVERSPDWKFGLPVVRHWWRTRHYVGQAVLVDLDAGVEVCASPNYLREGLYGFHASPDGKVLVGTCLQGKSIRVWRVPD